MLEFDGPGGVGHKKSHSPHPHTTLGNLNVLSEPNTSPHSLRGRCPCAHFIARWGRSVMWQIMAVLDPNPELFIPEAALPPPTLSLGLFCSLGASCFLVFPSPCSRQSYSCPPPFVGRHRRSCTLHSCMCFSRSSLHFGCEECRVSHRTARMIRI